ncbi:MAG: hypothetical protein ACHQ1H_08780 [Nitrososphaerales archaeon]
MEVKDYFRQNPVSRLIKYDKYEDTLRPDSKAARLISGKNAIGTVTEYARVERALVFDLFVLLFSMLSNIIGAYAEKTNPASQTQTSCRPDPHSRQFVIYCTSGARRTDEPGRSRQRDEPLPIHLLVGPAGYPFSGAQSASGRWSNALAQSAAEDSSESFMTHWKPGAPELMKR